MNEEQEKPKRKLNRIGNIFVFAIILGVLIFLVYIFVKGPVEKHDYDSCICHSSSDSSVYANEPKEPPYTSTKDDIQNAVFAYMTDHNGIFPTLNGTYSNICCQDCSVINISALLVPNGGWLRKVPDGFNLSVSGNDNCGGNASMGCRNTSSYIWIVDNYGNVFSYCAGTGCVTNNTCYQGVWP